MRQHVFKILQFYCICFILSNAQTAPPCGNFLHCYLSSGAPEIVLNATATYYLTTRDNITLTSNLNLTGNNATVVPLNTANDTLTIFGERMLFVLTDITFKSCSLVFTELKSLSIQNTKFLNYSSDPAIIGPSLLSIESCDQVIINNVEFRGNSISTLSLLGGGCLQLKSVKTVDISNTQFIDNNLEDSYALIYDGGIHDFERPVVISNSSFVNNFISDSQSTGCLINFEAPLIISNSFFQNTQCSYEESVTIHSQNLTIQSSYFGSNTSYNFACNTTLEDTCDCGNKTNSCSESYNITRDNCYMYPEGCCNTVLNSYDEFTSSYLCITPPLITSPMFTMPTTPDNRPSSQPSVQPSVQPSDSIICSNDRCLECSSPKQDRCVFNSNVLNVGQLIITEPVTITGNFTNRGNVIFKLTNDNPLIVQGCMNLAFGEESSFEINVTDVDNVDLIDVVAIQSPCISGDITSIIGNEPCFNADPRRQQNKLSILFSLKDECNTQSKSQSSNNTVGIVVGIIVAIIVIVAVLFVIIVFSKESWRDKIMPFNRRKHMKERTNIASI